MNGEPSKYSEPWLSTMTDIVTTLDRITSGHMDGVVASLEAEVQRRVSEDPWLQRNQYGVWSEWDQ